MGQDRMTQKEWYKRKEGMVTHKGSYGGDVLTLHGLAFREPRPNQDRVIGDLMGDLMRKARKCRSCPDERR